MAFTVGDSLTLLKLLSLLLATKNSDYLPAESDYKGTKNKHNYFHDTY
jgi:hypothetical protein